MTHSLRFTQYLISLVISFVIALGLLGCTPEKHVIPDPINQHSSQLSPDNLPAPETAQHFIELADLSDGIPRNRHLISAAQILVSQKQYDLAEIQLAGINQALLNDENKIETQLLSAEIELHKGNPRNALNRLYISSILPTSQQARLMQLRAQAFLDAGYPLESAKTREQLDKLLTDDFDLELNHQAIWEALSLLPKTSLEQISKAPLNPNFLAWVELSKIAKQAQTNNSALYDGIYQWQKKYPDHPAVKVFITKLGIKQSELLEKPKHIAVLLPLNGRYSQIADAIHDGIMSAYYLHPDKKNRPQISFIDTAENQAAIWNYYKQASDLGADFVIGPFLKPAVDVLTQAPQIDIPTLTLNYASTKTPAINNLFQFGLLPEDEARQAAEMAFRQKHTHAAILVPEGKWGKRLQTAFQLRFEELGGMIVSTQTYTPDKNDFKQPIQNMLNIQQSYSRYRRVQNITGTRMHFIPYRRQDVDMIFMAATPKDARQLKPQFKFHYAGEVPVYATSHAFTGRLNKHADRDIDDLNFLDMPWILNSPNKFKQSLINHWPEQQRYTRFFALGVDAYNLIPFLGRLQAKAYDRFSGQTGNLYLDPLNRIHRELLWAKFNRGVPKLVDINTIPINLTATDETELTAQPNK